MSPEYAREWVRKAEADRAAARRALQDSRRRKDQAEIACFHAQQCSEKYLKALLAQNGRHVPHRHDLWELARSLKGFGFPDAQLAKSLRVLNLYAVEVRYPGASAAFRDAQSALRAMERVVAASKRLLNLGGKAHRTRTS